MHLNTGFELFDQKKESLFGTGSKVLQLSDDQNIENFERERNNSSRVRLP